MEISRPGDQDAGNQDNRKCGSAILAEFSRAGSPCHDSDNHCLVTRYSDAHYDFKKQTCPEQRRMEPIRQERIAGQV